MKIHQAAELYEMLLFRAVEDAWTASQLGDTDMVVTQLDKQRSLIKRLRFLHGEAKAGKLIAEIYTNFNNEMKLKEVT